MQHLQSADFVIVGAGILGLSMASSILEHFPKANIHIIEKEKEVGLHASGRNSGVLHSGIYYPTSSLKAKLCAQGAQMMKDFCKAHNLPINMLGKVVIPTREDDVETLEMLLVRAKANGAEASLIDEAQLKELEPKTKSATGMALWVPETAVVDPLLITRHLYRDLKNKGVTFTFNQACTQVDTKNKKIVLANGEKNTYGHLINTAGLFADKIAVSCGLSQRYTMLPFKGLYYELTKDADLAINHLIYPVPDMNVPFLGVHFTKSVYDKVYVGPTAIPALGREHYLGVDGIKLKEASEILYQLTLQYIKNKDGFRAYAHQEAVRFNKSRFVAAASALVPSIKKDDLVLSKKVGIRAQLLDRKKKQLVTDFLVEKTASETHILNAVSPAFTSAFSFANHVVSQMSEQRDVLN